MAFPAKSFFIPNDIIIEILEQLPVKSLLRFRSVSKLWNLIINDSLFRENHHICSHTRPGGVNLILCVYSTNQGVANFYALNPEEGYAIHICTQPFCHFSSDCNFQCVDGLVISGRTIFSPSTREILQISPMTKLVPSCWSCHERLYKPMYFMGFDRSAKKYKVLGMCRGKQKPMVYKVLTVGTNEWRNVHPIPEEIKWSFPPGETCCVGDLIYCLFYSTTGPLLVAFEIGKERFRVMGMPSKAMYWLRLIELRGHLAIVGESENCAWILEDYENQKWRKKMLQFQDNEWTSSIPVGTIKSKDEILFYRWKDFTKQELHLAYYDLETRKSRMFQVPMNLFSLGLGDNNEVFITKHVENLFRLKD